jgi:hypothetical protein
MKLFWGFVILNFFAFSPGTAQDKSPSKAAWQAFYVEKANIRQRGTTALERERTRSKADLCTKAGSQSGKAISDCLDSEAKSTEQDYVIYVQAIGALLLLRAPGDEAQTTAEHLPFDAAEAAWLKYRDRSCESISRQWADVQSSISHGDCRLRLTWNHMNELAALYSDLWH